MVDPNAPLSASLLLKMQRRDVLSTDEIGVIEALIQHPSTVEARSDVIREGDRPTSSTLLVDGFLARYRVLANGARQITAIHTPGDFVDLHSFLLKEMDHGVVALTSARIARAPHAELLAISESHPHLSRMFSLLTLIDGAIHREWVVAMGRKPAKGHLAHLICEIHQQLECVNLTSNHEFLFPITQEVLADILGLSAVHVNRVLQELRAAEVITWNGANLRILDWERLVHIAQFDPRYLHFVKEPR